MILNTFNEYWRSVTARYRTSPLPEFLAWWRAELAGLVPQSLRQRMVPPRPALWLVADPDGGGIGIWAGGESPERLDYFGADEDVQFLRERWLSLINSFEDGNPQVRLCLPNSEVLECPVELPLAVEANLDTALGFQLDQLTPFRAQQVFFDYRVTGRDAEHGRLKLDLRLVPITRLEGIRERLSAIGIRPHIIDSIENDLDSDDAREGQSPLCGNFNLMPEAERPPYTYARARLNWMLAAAAVLVLAVVMAQSLYLRGQKVERLQAEVAALRDDAEQVMELQRQLEDSLAAANFLAERRRRQPVIIQVLDEISRILPDDIWLQQMQVRGNEVLMMGLADGSQRLIELINDSPILDDAEFRGAINVDPSTGQERFNARASVSRREVQRAVASEPGE